MFDRCQGKAVGNDKWPASIILFICTFFTCFFVLKACMYMQVAMAMTVLQRLSPAVSSFLWYLSCSQPFPQLWFYMLCVLNTEVLSQFLVPLRFYACTLHWLGWGDLGALSQGKDVVEGRSACSEGVYCDRTVIKKEGNVFGTESLCEWAGAFSEPVPQGPFLTWEAPCWSAPKGGYPQLWNRT